MRGVEAEIAFLIGKDLPPRPSPYTRDELVGSIASCHPAIELLESALRDPDAAESADSDCGFAVKWRIRTRQSRIRLAESQLRRRELRK